MFSFSLLIEPPDRDCLYYLTILPAYLIWVGGKPLGWLSLIKSPFLKQWRELPIRKILDSPFQDNKYILVFSLEKKPVAFENEARFYQKDIDTSSLFTSYISANLDKITLSGV